MKDANDLMSLALQMFRLLEKGAPHKERGSDKSVYAPLVLHEKAAIIAIVNSLFQAEIQEHQLLVAEQQRTQLLGNRAALTPEHLIADEYHQ